MWHRLTQITAWILMILVLVEVNNPFLTPQTQLAFFLGFAFLAGFPTKSKKWIQILVCLGFGVLAVLAFQYDPLFKFLWFDDSSLGHRAGAEGRAEWVLGILALIIVLAATSRLLGFALPILAVVFLAYAFLGPHLPNWMFPHRGYGLGRVLSQTMLQSQGVLGLALDVMFRYVFLFVLFGVFLEKLGSIQYILNIARRAFSNSQSGPAKVSICASALLGSLSGSAVANTATTGTFTIPLMKSSGFSSDEAGGIEAAASSGGALVPPVMGAGAYMMLEMVQPTVTYLQIIRAALLPAILYYAGLMFMVHFLAKRRHVQAQSFEPDSEPNKAAGLVFWLALALLIGFLIYGFSPFRSVSLSLLASVGVSFFHPKTRLSFSDFQDMVSATAKQSLPLVMAAACVGILMGVTTLTGLGAKLPGILVPLAQDHLLFSLLALMMCSLVLGMGLPSAVCYLLLATLVGPVLGKIGVPPLAAHFFIFYFGLMSMVTPPVALAAYAAASLSKGSVVRTAIKAFTLSIPGFILPFLFVMRPELLLLEGNHMLIGLLMALWFGGCLFVFAVSMAGFFKTKMSQLARGLGFVLSFVCLAIGCINGHPLTYVGGAVISLVFMFLLTKNLPTLSTK